MKLWVVEMWVGNRWQPTVGAAMTRRDGYYQLRFWCSNNPNDRFRLWAYEPSKRRP